jgi:hypothetical protein
MWRIYENIGARGGHFLHKENKDEKIEDLSVFPSVVDQSTQIFQRAPLVTTFSIAKRSRDYVGMEDFGWKIAIYL